MKTLFALFILLALSTAFADCVTDFRKLHDRKDIKLVEDRKIEIINKRHMKYLIEPEVKAVQDYMSLKQFTFDGDNGLAITTEEYIVRKTEESVGYRISITDGGEYSHVRYYLKVEKKGNKVSYPILFRVQKAETRITEYICEE